jgi:signal transduction histidine kinase
MTEAVRSDFVASPSPASVRLRRRRDASQQLVPYELAFLRFSAGCRALLALLTAFGLLALAPSHSVLISAVVLPYLVWSAVLLWRTLAGWPKAASRWWLWLDAAVLLLASYLMADQLPLFGISIVLPVVALALLAGVLPAIALAVASAAVMLLGNSWGQGTPQMPALPVLLPVLLLIASPTAALLTAPSRGVRQQRLLVESFARRADPRHGLQQHVDALLGLLAEHFALRDATLSLHGPQPRIFQWQAGRVADELADADLAVWRERLTALPTDRGCLTAAPDALPAEHAKAYDPAGGIRAERVGDAARAALRDIGGPALTLPLHSFGQPLGMLCLRRAHAPFTAADLHWLHDVMREAMPLLERADLLEQLQRESAARERERIGRDLHDSAVQPYIGLKYGLEALARQAGPHNPVHGHIQQLLRMTHDELHTLRDVVSGLRSGTDPSQPGSSLAALQRQAERFQQLFGLKVNIFASQAPRLRGAVAKAVLHMVNEALTNIRRHTSATSVTVLLDVRDSDLVLRVRNDHPQGDAIGTDFVPKSLAERAAEFRGSISIADEADYTEMTITLPLLASIA